MHISYLPSGQRSRLKEVIQMQISSDINPRRRRENLFSAFRASQGQRVSLHIFFLPSLVWFRLFCFFVFFFVFFFFQGVFLVRLLTLSFVSLYSFLSSVRRLFGDNRQ